MFTDASEAGEPIMYMVHQAVRGAAAESAAPHAQQTSSVCSARSDLLVVLLTHLRANSVDVRPGGSVKTK